MVRISSLPRPSLSLLLPALFLFLASTTNIATQNPRSMFSAQGNDHGLIPQAGSQPDFQMQIPPNQFLLKTGAWANLSIYFTPLYNFSGTISLSGTASPTGSSAPTFRLPATAKVNWTISGIPRYFMIVNTTTSTPLGLYTITVVGVSGPISHTVTVALGVTNVSVPSNGAELAYSGNFTTVAYAGRVTTLNNTFEDLGYVTVGISKLTVVSSFGTYPSTNGSSCIQNCWLTTVSPFTEKTTNFTIQIPANMSPGNYSVTLTVNWFVGPGTIYQTSGPDLITHGSIIVYSTAPGPLGSLNLSGLTSILLGVVGGVAASAAIMSVLLFTIERRRKDPFRSLAKTSVTSAPPQLGTAAKRCPYCGQTVPVGEFCAECGTRLY
jgi:hypothetical protein